MASTQNKKKTLKIVIIILSILLALSVGGLVFRYVYVNYISPDNSTAVVPDNIIGNETSTETPEQTGGTSAPSTGLGTAAPETGGGAVTPGTTPETEAGSATDLPATDPKPTSSPDVTPTPTPDKTEAAPVTPDKTEDTTEGEETEEERFATKLELYKGNGADNERFNVTNMFPGDTVEKYYCIKTAHNKPVELYFAAPMTAETKALSKALKIKVTYLNSGEVLFDGTYSEIQGKEFAVSLMKNDENSTESYYKIEVYAPTSMGNEYMQASLEGDFKWYVKDDSALDPPGTGDRVSGILTVSAITSVTLLVILLLAGKRREKEENDD